MQPTILIVGKKLKKGHPQVNDPFLFYQKKNNYCLGFAE